MNKNKRPFVKYNNVKTEIDGIIFDSKKEANRYLELKILERAGAVRCLEIQVPFNIAVNDVKICTYKADFTYQRKKILDDGWEYIVEDVKGVKTPIYNLKKKLMFACFKIKILET